MGGQGFHHLGGRRGRQAFNIRPGPQQAIQRFFPMIPRALAGVGISSPDVDGYKLNVTQMQ